MKWAIAAFGACCLAALVATWPLMVHSTYTIPLGTEREATVPVFSLWTLWWNANRAAHGFQGYWDAPIFHPIEGTLAFSEPQLLTGILMAPLWAANVPPALIYNLALVAMLALNGFFTYRLARALTVPPAPALIAGVMAVTLPFAAKHLGVLPVLPLFGIAWTLEGLVRFGEGGSWRHAFWAAAGFTVEFLASQQLALLFAPFAAIGGLVALTQRRWRLRSLLVAAGAGLLVLAVVMAVAEPGRRLRAQQGFERSERTVYLLSASPHDFLSRPATAMVPVPPPSTPEQGDTAGLFPGLILLGLAVAGAVRGLRSPDKRRWIVFLLLSVLLALLLALGLKLAVAGWRPFVSFAGELHRSRPVA
ncbi:MAG: hypothetical protein V3T72_18105 [Thermoanaerobaculia bacterium]